MKKLLLMAAIILGVVACQKEEDAVTPGMVAIDEIESSFTNEELGALLDANRAASFQRLLTSKVTNIKFTWSLDYGWCIDADIPDDTFQSAWYIYEYQWDKENEEWDYVSTPVKQFYYAPLGDDLGFGGTDIVPTDGYGYQLAVAQLGGTEPETIYTDLFIADYSAAGVDCNFTAPEFDWLTLIDEASDETGSPVLTYEVNINPDYRVLYDVNDEVIFVQLLGSQVPVGTCFEETAEALFGCAKEIVDMAVNPPLEDTPWSPAITIDTAAGDYTQTGVFDGVELTRSANVTKGNETSLLSESTLGDINADGDLLDYQVTTRDFTLVLYSDGDNDEFFGESTTTIEDITAAPVIPDTDWAPAIATDAAVGDYTQTRIHAGEEESRTGRVAISVNTITILKETDSGIDYNNDGDLLDTQTSNTQVYNVVYSTGEVQYLRTESETSVVNVDAPTSEASQEEEDEAANWYHEYHEEIAGINIVKNPRNYPAGYKGQVTANLLVKNANAQPIGYFTFKAGYKNSVRVIGWNGMLLENGTYIIPAGAHLTSTIFKISGGRGYISEWGGSETPQEPVLTSVAIAKVGGSLDGKFDLLETETTGYVLIPQDQYGEDMGLYRDGIYNSFGFGIEEKPEGSSVLHTENGIGFQGIQKADAGYYKIKVVDTERGNAKRAGMTINVVDALTVNVGGPYKVGVGAIEFQANFFPGATYTWTTKVGNNPHTHSVTGDYLNIGIPKANWVGKLSVKVTAKLDGKTYTREYINVEVNN